MNKKERKLFKYARKMKKYCKDNGANCEGCIFGIEWRDNRGEIMIRCSVLGDRTPMNWFLDNSIGGQLYGQHKARRRCDD